MEQIYTHSEAIDQIADALSKAQAEMRGATKDSTNPHFKSKYADLESVWDACRLPLTKYGLSVVQPVSSSGRSVAVATMLMHKSGQWLSSSLTLTAQQDTPQAIGSAITYGRRYGLSAMAGIAPEDDDGNAASGNGKGSKDAAQHVAQAKIARMREQEAAELAEAQKPVAVTQPRAASKEFDMLEAFGEIKKKFQQIDATTSYYAVLGRHGYEKSNQIPTKEAGKVIFKEMAKELTRLKGEQGIEGAA
jgi:hypothetical protein